MQHTGDDSTERELNESPVSVQIVPEKKGLFLKHSEYEVRRAAHDHLCTKSDPNVCMSCSFFYRSS